MGTVFEVLLAILVMPTLGWRWLLGLSTIPLFIFAILCFVSLTVPADRVRVCVTRDSFINVRGRHVRGCSGYRRALDTTC